MSVNKLSYPAKENATQQKINEIIDELGNVNKDTMRSTEFIVGTQNASTGSWTGVTEDSLLYDGKNINYFLPYDGSGNASLNLTLSGGTTTSAKPVYLYGTTYVTTQYVANSCINMTYNATKDAWFVNADRDKNDNTYDRVKNSNNIYAVAACTNGKLICGTSSGYKDVAASVTFDIDYPVLYCGTAAAATKTTNNTYLTFPGVNLQTTKSSWTGTQYSVVYLVGTLSGKTFTIDSSVFTTTVPSTQDNKVYIPVGVLYSTYQCYFTSCKDMYSYIDGSFQRISTKYVQGSGTQPIYFDSNGQPQNTTYTLSKSVPSNAVFTDANVTQTVKTDGSSYPILGAPTGQTATTTTTSVFAEGIKLVPEFGALNLQSTAGKGAGGRIRLLEPSDKSTLANSEIITSDGKLQIKGYASGDGTTVTGAGTALTIDPYAKTITGDYTITGSLSGNSTSATKCKLIRARDSITDANNLRETSYVHFDELTTSTTNAPSAKWYHYYTSGSTDSNYASQLALGMTSINCYHRNYNSGTWGGWRQFVFNGTVNTATGSTTQPVYIDADGTATTIGYTIAKSVPSDAVFTDTKNTAGSTDTSSKIFLIGATSQAANPQTYSQDTVFVDTDGMVNSSTPTAGDSSTKVATTAFVGTALGDYVTLSTAQTISGVKTHSAALHFANNTWNNMGDDAKIGDHNVSGHICIKPSSSTYDNSGGISFHNSSDTALVQLNASSGALTSSGSLGVTNNAVKMQYNSTTEALDFVFA